MMREVTVDWDYCVGSGDCVRTAPNAFRLDEEEGMAEVLEGVEEVDVDTLVDAAMSCPTNAITVRVDDEVLVEGA